MLSNATCSTIRNVFANLDVPSFLREQVEVNSVCLKIHFSEPDFEFGIEVRVK